MNNPFINKVDAQRIILKTVNSHVLVSNQLTGLTGSAINTWLLNAGISFDHPVSKSLLNLSELCQLLSDHSHETFQPLPVNLASKIDSEIFQLQRGLSLLSA